MFYGSASFLQENGIYIFFVMLVRRPLSFLRNGLLARKLGVRSLRIGRGSRPGAAFPLAKIGENFSVGDGLWM